MGTLSAEEAADRMKIHKETLMEYIRQGILPAAKIGRAYVLLEQDVMAFIANQIKKQTAVRQHRSVTTTDDLQDLSLAS